MAKTYSGRHGINRRVASERRVMDGGRDREARKAQERAGTWKKAAVL
jgi:hypothetical protein